MMFAAEFTQLAEYREKLDRMLAFTSALTPIGIIVNARICNGVYAYTLNQPIALSKTSQILSRLTVDGRPKYGIAFHNWNSRKQIRVIIPVNGALPTEAVESDKLQAHRFLITQGGSVRQYSPTSQSNAIAAYQQLLHDLQVHVFTKGT
jgi:hypothetical protein